MTAAPPALFEAIVTPPRSFTRGGFGVVAGLLIGASLPASALFLALGAWPVLGFLGAEIALALGLMLAHARWSGRQAEVILVRDGIVSVTRTDHHGVSTTESLPASWARVEETPGVAPEIVLRDRRIAFGRHLTREERAGLAGALAAALRRARA